MESRSQQFTLDSTFFVAFEMTHDALRFGLKESSDLSMTDYRVLVMLLNLAPEPCTQADIGRLLQLKPNVISTSINTLESKGMAKRRNNASDGRAHSVLITSAGITHIAAVNAAIVSNLQQIFPTDHPSVLKLFKSTLAASAQLDMGRFFKENMNFPASRALVTMDLIRQITNRSLKARCKAGYNECRVLQLLGERGVPERVTHLALALHLVPVNVARAADRLEARGWVERLNNPYDRKAVFIALTDQGAAQIPHIQKAMEDIAYETVGSRISEEQAQDFRDAIMALADDMKRMRAEKLAHESHPYAHLVPNASLPNSLGA